MVVTGLWLVIADQVLVDPSTNVNAWQEGELGVSILFLSIGSVLLISSIFHGIANNPFRRACPQPFYAKYRTESEKPLHSMCRNSNEGNLNLAYGTENHKKNYDDTQ